MAEPRLSRAQLFVHVVEAVSHGVDGVDNEAHFTVLNVIFLQTLVSCLKRAGKKRVFTPVIHDKTESFILEVENKHDGAVKQPGKSAFFRSVFAFSGAFTQQTLNYSKANMQKKKSASVQKHFAGGGGRRGEQCAPVEPFFRCSEFD